MPWNILQKWRNKLGLSDEAIDRFDFGDWDKELKSIDDVKTVLLFSREFGVKYKGIEALITTSGSSGFSVQSTDNFFDTDDLDDFAENAMLGSYRLKDIVGKWEITWHA